MSQSAWLSTQGLAIPHVNYCIYIDTGLDAAEATYRHQVKFDRAHLVVQ